MNITDQVDVEITVAKAQASVQVVNNVWPLIEELAAYSDRYRGETLDKGAFRRRMQALGDQAGILVAQQDKPVGVLVYTIGAHLCCTDEAFVGETVFWISSELPGTTKVRTAKRLIQAMEDIGTKAGCRYAMMSTPTEEPNAVYRRAGFEPLEMNYVKEL